MSDKILVILNKKTHNLLTDISHTIRKRSNLTKAPAHTQTIYKALKALAKQEKIK